MKYLSTVRSTQRGELMTATPSRVEAVERVDPEDDLLERAAGIARTITAPQSSSGTPPAVSRVAPAPPRRPRGR